MLPLEGPVGAGTRAWGVGPRVSASPYQTSIFPLFFFFFFTLAFCLFWGRFPRHMEVPRLGVQSELQPPAYARSRATWDPSHVCHLPHSSRQCRILNPLSKARDRTRNFMVPSRIHYPLRHHGNSDMSSFVKE